MTCENSDAMIIPRASASSFSLDWRDLHGTRIIAEIRIEPGANCCEASVEAAYESFCEAVWQLRVPQDET